MATNGTRVVHFGACVVRTPESDSFGGGRLDWRNDGLVHARPGQQRASAEVVHRWADWPNGMAPVFGKLERSFNGRITSTPTMGGVAVVHTVQSVFIAIVLLLLSGQAEEPLQQEPNTWVKRSPLPGGPPSPRLGYEGACVYDTVRRVMIRYGGHNQGGGGEQGSEVWLFDPRTARWRLMLPNTSPPGVCCAQQAVFDPVSARFIRFPAFSGSHGWQWFREIYLNDSTIWVYDPDANRWTNLRPLPAPRVNPLRCASWDGEFQVVVVFGGEGNREGTVVYDPYTNQWYWMRPKHQPPFRSAGNMAYDSQNKVHVLFGSQFSDDPFTWLYSLRDNRWERRRPDPSPPTDRNDAVLCYDSIHGKIIAVVKITTGEREQAKHRLETWTYDVATNRWTRMQPLREPDPSGNRARQLMFAPDLNVALLENRVGRRENAPPEQQIWTYRLAPRVASQPLPRVKGLRATTREGGVILTWDPVQDDRVRGLVVEHAVADVPWRAQFREVATLSPDETRFEHAPKLSGVPLYRVRCLDRDGRTGPPSQFVRAQPRIIEQIVVSVTSPRAVRLSWQPPSGAEDIAGYVVERAPVAVRTNEQLTRIAEQTPPGETPAVGAVEAIGRFQRIATSVRGCEYEDAEVDLGQPVAIAEPVFRRKFSREHLREGRPYPWAVYAYRIRAVNRLGIESGPSPYALTIPSSPQFVFAREDGDRCELKWAPNPEQGIVGYRVYRMDGRFRGSAVHPVHTGLIKSTRFVDQSAGKRTRRYYIVAVDRLGQEGAPSAPVWYRREWQRFYEPFVGEWHQ